MVYQCSRVVGKCSWKDQFLVRKNRVKVGKSTSVVKILVTLETPFSVGKILM